MGAVNTTYTFTATDTITSTKMNNIIDETTITTDAIIGTTLDVASGKLKVRSQGITSNEMATSSVTQPSLAANVVGNGPVFSAYASANQTLNNSVETKVTLGTENFDTNSNFASSRFTPTVAGFYLVCGSVAMTDNTTELLTAKIYKNGSEYVSGTRIAAAANSSTVSTIVQMNGSSDYVELYARQATSGGAAKTIVGASNATFLTGCLIRSA